MKKVRLCFEVQGLAVDEAGKPAPAGMGICLGEVPDEKYAAVMEKIKGIKAIDLLRGLGSPSIADKYSESDFRMISPEEYDREYGYDQEAEAALEKEAEHD